MKKILFLLLPLLVRAEPTTLSRTEAFELHSALTALSPGLSPENTFAAADDINALEVTAKTFRAGYTKVLQLQQAAQAAPTPENMALFHETDTKFAAATEERKTYDLKALDITKEELKAANISATTLATIRRLLKPDTPAKK